MKRLIALLLLLTACQKDPHQLKIAASPVPHADLLEVIAPDLKAQGITLKILEVDDYHLPNRLLKEGKVDANFFQHQPYLDVQTQEFGYDFDVLARVHIEPLGIYSEKHNNLEAIPERAIVAIPADPTNEARALNLLQSSGLIELSGKNKLSTTLDVTSNPYNLRFHELDAPLLPRTLGDVDYAVIPANFALQGDLVPDEDALSRESAGSPYVNLVVIRRGDQERPEIQALAAALRSEKLKAYIQERYQGAITPAF